VTQLSFWLSSPRLGVPTLARFARVGTPKLHCGCYRRHQLRFSLAHCDGHTYRTIKRQRTNIEQAKTENRLRTSPGHISSGDGLQAKRPARTRFRRLSPMHTEDVEARSSFRQFYPRYSLPCRRLKNSFAGQKLASGAKARMYSQRLSGTSKLVPFPILPIRFFFQRPAPLVATFLLAFALAGSFQAIPAVAQQQPGPPDADSAKEPEAKTGGKKVLATIIQSRSTNTLPYTVAIYRDGSATAKITGVSAGIRSQVQQSPQPSPAPQEFPPRTIDTKTLRHLLTEIQDVSRIPTGTCPKSVSFGTRTQISYAGKTSGDLQCVREPSTGADQTLLQTSQDLSRFVQTTLRELKIDAHRLGR